MTTTTVKEGLKTTEFLSIVIVDVAATVLLVMHKITNTEWTAMTGGTTSIYALARSWLKG